MCWDRGGSVKTIEITNVSLPRCAVDSVQAVGKENLLKKYQMNERMKNEITTFTKSVGKSFRDSRISAFFFYCRVAHFWALLGRLGFPSFAHGPFGRGCVGCWCCSCKGTTSKLHFSNHYDDDDWSASPPRLKWRYSIYNILMLMYGWYIILSIEQ